MPLLFYPQLEDAQRGTLSERLEVLMESAERFKAIILDESAKSMQKPIDPAKRSTPRDLSHAYNWEEIARVLQEIRNMPEGTKEDKAKKYNYLNKLSEIYEVLRAAKMPKLDAVRLALINEANQFKV